MDERPRRRPVVAAGRVGAAQPEGAARSGNVFCVYIINVGDGCACTARVASVSRRQVSRRGGW
ncbi:MAG: hypothetical protein LBK07_11235 [Tannerella sp.]|nr:hypothetical protein [Tannerella sp.]